MIKDAIPELEQITSLVGYENILETRIIGRNRNVVVMNKDFYGSGWKSIFSIDSEHIIKRYQYNTGKKATLVDRYTARIGIYPIKVIGLFLSWQKEDSECKLIRQGDIVLSLKEEKSEMTFCVILNNNNKTIKPLCKIRHFDDQDIKTELSYDDIADFFSHSLGLRINKIINNRF